MSPLPATASGWTNIDVAAATRLGIVVTDIPEFCTTEVADHTMALLSPIPGTSSSLREWRVPVDGPTEPSGRCVGSAEAIAELQETTARNVAAALRGGLSATVVNPDVRSAQAVALQAAR